MRLAPLSRRPAALLAATALVAVGALGARPAAAATVTITSVTNPVNALNAAKVQVIGTATPGDTVSITARDASGATSSKPDAVVTRADGTFDDAGGLDVYPLADGVLTVTVTSAMSGSVSRTVVKDTQYPAGASNVSIAPLVVNAANKDAVTVTATAAGTDVKGLRLTITDGTTELTQRPDPTGSPQTATFDVTPLKDGAITAVVGTSDAAGNESTVSKAFTKKDTVAPGAPTVTVAGQTAAGWVNAATPGAGNKLTVSGTGSESATYLLTVTDSSGTAKTFAPASSTPATSYSLTVDPYQFADGQLALAVVATDTAGNAGPAGSASVKKDTSVPSVTGLTVTPSPINNAKKAAVAVTGTSASEAGTRVLLHPTGTLSNPVLQSPPADQTVTIGPGGAFTATFDTTNYTDAGGVTFSATPTDPAGNTGAAVTRATGKDTVAPGAPTISSLANATPGNVSAVPVSGTAEAGSTVVVTVKDAGTGSVSGSAVATGGSFSLSLDLSSLADGTVTATAVATDVAGNSGATSAAVTAGKDTTTFGLVSAAPTGTTSPSSTVRATYNEPLDQAGSSILVRTSPGNVPVAGNTSYSTDRRTIVFTPTGGSFTSGSYTASITGKESGVGNDPAIVTPLAFTVDASAPNAPVISTVTNPVNKANQAVVHVTGTAEAGSSVVVTVTDSTTNALMQPAPKSVTSAPVTAGPTGAFDAVLDLTSLKDGALAATAVATDTLGNASSASAVASSTKDTAAPTVSGVAATGVTQAAPRTTVTATSSESGDSVLVTLRDATGAAVTATTTSGTNGAISVEVDPAALSDGTISVSVVATDAAGNASAPGTASFSKDVTGPTVTGLAGTAATVASAGKTTVTGSLGGPGTVTITVTQGATSVTATPTVASNGAFSATLDVSGLADGTLAVTAVGKDSAGNTGPTGSTSVAKDTAKPVVTGLAATGATAGSPVTTVTGTTEAGLSVLVRVTDGTRTSTKTVVAGGNGAFSTTFDLTGFRSGALPVTATATDAVGNVGNPAGTTAAYDASGPTITGLTATAVSIAHPATTVTGSSDDPAAPLTLTAKDKNGGTRSTPVTPAADGSFTATLDLTPLADGPVTVTVGGTDTNGNVGVPASTTTTKDTVAPQVSGLGVTVSGTTATVTGAVNDTTGSVALTATQGALTRTGSAAVGGNGRFSGTLDLTGFDGSATTVTAVATDAVGNRGQASSTTFSKDGTLPQISGLAATATNRGVPSSTVTGTVSDRTATIALLATDANGATKAGTATVDTAGRFSGSLDLSSLADGTVTVKATATAPAGATGSATTTTTKSSALPAPAKPTVVPGDGRATVSFTTVTGATRYAVTTTSSTGDRLTTTGTGSPIVVTSLVNGTAYTATVHATDATGDSAESPASDAFTPRSSSQVTLNALPQLVRQGTAITLSGTVTRGDTSVAPAAVTLRYRNDAGVVRTLGTTVPSSSGAYAFRVTPGFNATYAAVYGGDARNGASLQTAGRRTLVAVRITVSAPAGSASTAQVIRGGVAPNKAGRILSLYRVRSDGSLVRIATTRASSSSGYSFSVRLTRGNHLLQVGMDATSGNAAGATRFVAKRT